MAISPLESLFDVSKSATISLPKVLSDFVDPFRLALHAHRPTVIANFVSTLDGVTTLNEPDHAGGGDISGFNRQDHALMGLWRALADAVIVGAGTLRVDPKHVWTAEFIYPDLAPAYQELRQQLGKKLTPLNVIVSASGNLEPHFSVLQSDRISALIVTTAFGQQRLQAHSFSDLVQIVSTGDHQEVSARKVLEAVQQVRPGDLYLLEGGPRLLNTFLTEHCLDELCLTLAPQIAGRTTDSKRPGLVEGQNFAPTDPRWSRLRSVKRGENHLFLRYAFNFHP